MDVLGINILDLILGGAVIISVLVGIARGLVKEILSLFAWVITLWLAWKFAGRLSDELVSKFISDEHISYIASFGVIFLVSLFAIGLLNLLISSLFNAVGLTGFDRLLGALFGLARGAVICSVLVFFAQLYPSIDREPWWQQSKLVPGFMNIAGWGISKLPPNVRAQADASLRSRDVGVLLPSIDPNAQPAQDNAEKPAISLTSLEDDTATRPQTGTANQTAQGNALSNMGEGIRLESMSDDSTVDQDTDNIPPDSDEPAENTAAPTINDIPEAPALQLESTQ